jgi:4-hydroxybenzoate polyprenyltransferase
MKKLLKLLSWRNLGILRYNAIWQNLSALFYIGFVENLFSAVFLVHVLAFMLFSTFMTGYGYLANDLSDMDLDRMHGKANAFQNMSRSKAVFVVISMLLIGSLFAIPFWQRSQFWVVWIIWVFVATCYSIPPLRLKERGSWGLLATIIAQQTLPTTLLFASFGNLASLGALCFIVYATIRGASSDISHQMRDWINDVQTQTRTFAVRHGVETTKKIYALCLESERVSIGLILIVLLLDLPHIKLPIFGWQTKYTWPLLAMYIPLFALTVGRSWSALRNNTLPQNDPYDEIRQTRQRDTLHIIHHTFPSVIVPVYLSMLSIFSYWPNIIFLIILGLVYARYLPKYWHSIQSLSGKTLNGRSRQ